MNLCGIQTVILDLLHTRKNVWWGWSCYLFVMLLIIHHDIKSFLLHRPDFISMLLVIINMRDMLEFANYNPLLTYTNFQEIVKVTISNDCIWFLHCSTIRSLSTPWLSCQTISHWLRAICTEIMKNLKWEHNFKQKLFGILHRWTGTMKRSRVWSINCRLKYAKMKMVLVSYFKTYFLKL